MRLDIGALPGVKSSSFSPTDAGMAEHEQLVHLLATRSARRGQFTLASGRQSTLYIDARLTTMSPEGLALIGTLGLTRIRESWRADSVGGLTLGADPISYAISYASSQSETPLRAFTVRKEPKLHGTGKLIEGPFRQGDHSVVIEDVLTTGSSALKAISAVREAGGIVTGVLALVDREEGAREAIQTQGIAVISLVKAHELLPLIPTS
jgi:orotate phosphoribosyltransferase